MAARIVILVASVSLAIQSPGWTTESPQFDTPSSNLMNAKGKALLLPAHVIITPFMAYEAGSGKPSVTKFEGSVVVDLRTYLAVVIVGEISNAGELNKLTEPNRGNAKAEAFRAQAQAALNCLLYRMAYPDDFQKGTNPVVKIDVDTVTVSGENPGLGKKGRAPGSLVHEM